MEPRDLKLVIVGGGVIFVIVVASVLIALFQIEANSQKISANSRKIAVYGDETRKALCPVLGLIILDDIEHGNISRARVVKKAYKQLQCSSEGG